MSKLLNEAGFNNPTVILRCNFSISNIFSKILKQPLYDKPSTQLASEYMKREGYREGRFTSENNLDEELGQQN